MAHQSRRCSPPVAMTTAGEPLQTATRRGTPVTAAVQAVAVIAAVAEAMMVVAEETVAEAVEVTDARDALLRTFDSA